MIVGGRLPSRPAQVALVACTAIAVGVFVATVPTFRHFFDLGVYRGSVRYWLVDGGHLYDFRYRDSDYGFTYPPFAALVMAPLVLTSWPIAVTASLAVNTAMVVLLLRWFAVPILRRRSWPIWTSCALAFLAFLMFEPARDTFSFGQINLVLLVLVCADMRALATGRRGAGVGIGLAAAIKLTPAVFIGYLLLSRQYRAAATATATAAGATILTAIVAPGPSRDFWTDALWDTGRVGRMEYVSNQSLRGVMARLEAPAIWWVAAVALVLAYWSWWVRTRRTPGDQAAGFAVTGIVACLISPVTWVHHLVWVLPALFWLLDRGRTLVAGVAYVLLGSSFVWLWWAHPFGWAAFAGSNLYVWIAVALMAFVTAADLRVPDLWRHAARRSSALRRRSSPLRGRSSPLRQRSSALRRRPAQGTDVAG
jgi:alpha-1,2-mannosyltransferase